MLLPPEFTAEMRAVLGCRADDFFAEYEKPAHNGLRLSAKHADKPVLSYLPWRLAPIPGVGGGFYLPEGAKPGLHPLHGAGAYYLQEPSAMTAAARLGVMPDDFVLDLCAAPGGKASQLCERVGKNGLFAANEIHPVRVRALYANLERLGLGRALIFNETPERLAERFPAFFDKILVDAPCSGEGMFRKNPETISQWSPDAPRICHARQAGILDQAAKMLKPGGRILYSTCTFNRRENEGTVEAFLGRHPGFRAECARIWPHEFAGEGHFVCVIDDASGSRRQLSRAPATPARGFPPADAQGRLSAMFGDLDFGRTEMFGGHLCAVQQNTPDLRGLKVASAGLQLLRVEKGGRVTPAHALAMALRAQDAPRSVELGPELASQYLSGRALDVDCAPGWALACVHGCAVGWVKAVPGRLQNHLPKGLRL